MENNIKQVIKEKGIKQTYICEKLGINESVLSLIINGKRKPSQDRLKALAKILNVSIKTLYPNVVCKKINYYYIQESKRMNEYTECKKCDGTGHDIFMEGDGIICPQCNGTGEQE